MTWHRKRADTLGARLQPPPRWAPLRTAYSAPGDQSAVCFERSLSIDTCEQDVALALPA